jgi:hypothetical protein
VGSTVVHDHTAVHNNWEVLLSPGALVFQIKAKIKFGEPVHSLLAVCNSTIAGNGTLDNGVTFGEKVVTSVAEGSLALCLEFQDVRYAADLGGLIVMHLLVAGPQVARIVGDHFGHCVDSHTGNVLEVLCLGL